MPPTMWQLAATAKRFPPIDVTLPPNPDDPESGELTLTLAAVEIEYNDRVYAYQFTVPEGLPPEGLEAGYDNAALSAARQALSNG